MTHNDNSPPDLPENLPKPSQEEQAHSDRLVELIQQEMQASSGKIPFNRFMELALYAPGLGYYSAGTRKFGEAGDFVTAPELSPLFSRCIAHQCRQILSKIPKASILEAGPGSGAMAADILAELERLGELPDRYYLLETSADLRQRQRETIQQKVPHLASLVQWLDELPNPGFRGVVLGNELLDAMPVHRFCLHHKETAELYVAYENNRFVWKHGPVTHPVISQRLSQIGDAVPMEIEYESEINLAAEAWIRSVADSLESGLVLLFDYGFPRKEFYHPQRSGGTLMCHYRHRSHGDPLILVGLQDITAHVDFSAVAQAADEAGLAVAGYTTQAYFLINSGLEELTAETPVEDTRAYWDIAQQVKKLTLPSEMGELFKVIGLTKNFNESLLGFRLMDQRSRL